MTWGKNTHNPSTKARNSYSVLYPQPHQAAPGPTGRVTESTRVCAHAQTRTVLRTPGIESRSLKLPQRDGQAGPGDGAEGRTWGGGAAGGRPEPRPCGASHGTGVTTRRKGGVGFPSAFPLNRYFSFLLNWKYVVEMKINHKMAPNQGRVTGGTSLHVRPH